jgi:beta-mannanase
MIALGAVAAMGAVAAPTAPAADGVRVVPKNIIIGASGGDAVTILRQRVGGKLAAHAYGSLSGKPITDARFVNIEPDVSWARVADGSRDSDIRRWAHALTRKQIVLVSFSHEPMAKQNAHLGTAQSFIAAFRHVEQVFASVGARNVEWVWNVTSDSFRVPSSSSKYGSKWYPGDAYVDDVAGEAYNKAGCGQSEKSFADKISDIFRFARQHDKRMVVAEFAANKYSGRADWLRAASRFITAHRSDFRGAFYYQSTTHHAGGCRWALDSRAEYAALEAMAQSL